MFLFVVSCFVFFVIFLFFFLACTSELCERRPRCKLRCCHGLAAGAALLVAGAPNLRIVDSLKDSIKKVVWAFAAALRVSVGDSVCVFHVRVCVRTVLTMILRIFAMTACAQVASSKLKHHASQGAFYC